MKELRMTQNPCERQSDVVNMKMHEMYFQTITSCQSAGSLKLQGLLYEKYLYIKKTLRNYFK